MPVQALADALYCALLLVLVSNYNCRCAVLARQKAHCLAKCSCIMAPCPYRNWAFHVQAGSLAAKAAKRKRTSNSVRRSSLTPPPQGQALPGSVQQYNHHPATATQPYQSDQEAALSATLVQSHTSAAPVASHPGLSAAAMLDPCAHGHELLADGVLVQPLPSYLPHAGPGTPPQSHVHPTRGLQGAHAAQLQPPTATAQDWPNTSNYGQAESITAGLTGTRKTTVSNAAGDMHMPAMATTVSTNGALGCTPAIMPPRKGFGGILSGVVKEAAKTATKRPPVFRYEDFKTVRCLLCPSTYQCDQCDKKDGI